MRLELDIDKFKDALDKNGFGPTSIDLIVETVMQGLPFKLNEFSMEFKAGQCKLTIGDPNNEDRIPAVSDFDLQLPGLDCSNVMSVEIPTLDASSAEVFSLGIRVLPFNLFKPIKLS